MSQSSDTPLTAAALGLTTFRLYFTGFTIDATPVEPLEDRVKRFFEAEPNTESLDGSAFDQVNGSATKADYLIGQRRLIAELKTINGDPKDRVEQRLRERFRQPDAPYVVGRYGLGPVLESMPDQAPLTKMINDLQSRAVRRHLQKTNEQISATKARLSLPEAAGLVVLMNDGEPMIDAANMGYAVKSAFETVEGGYPHINYVWISVERHKVALSERPGFPQLLVTRTAEPPPHFQLLVNMLEAWAAFNGARFLEATAFQGEWDLLSPIYDDGVPELEIY